MTVLIPLSCWIACNMQASSRICRSAGVPSRSLKTSLALWKYVTELRRAATRHLTELGLPEVRLIAVFSSLPEGIEISEQVGLLITPHERELWTTPLLKRLDLEAGFPDPECHAQAFGIVARWTRTVALASKERAGPDATSSAVRALARQVTDADPKNAGAIAYVDVYLDVSNAWVSMFY